MTAEAGVAAVTAVRAWVEAAIRNRLAAAPTQNLGTAENSHLHAISGRRVSDNDTL